MAILGSENPKMALFLAYLYTDAHEFVNSRVFYSFFMVFYCF